MDSKHERNMGLLRRYKSKILLNEKATNNLELTQRLAENLAQVLKIRNVLPEFSLRDDSLEIHTFSLLVNWIRENEFPLIQFSFPRFSAEPGRLFQKAMKTLSDDSTSFKMKLQVLDCTATTFESIILLYELGFEIIYLSIKFSRVLPTIERVTKLTNEMKLKNVTTLAVIECKTFSNVTMFEEIARLCPSLDTCLVSKKNVLSADTEALNLSTEMQDYITEITFGASKNAIFINASVLRIKIASLIEIQSFLSYLSRPERIFILNFTNFHLENRPTRGSFNGFTLGRSKQILKVENRLLLNNLEKVLKDMHGIYRITIRGQDIRELGQNGEEIFHRYLKNNLDNALREMIENRRTARYNRGKVMVMGDGAAGKTSTVRSISNLPFTKEHNRTEVASKINIVDSSANDWKVIGENQDGFVSDLTYTTSSVFKRNTPVPKTPTSRRRKMPPISPQAVITTGIRINSSKNSDTSLSLSTKDVEIQEPVVDELEQLSNPMKLSWWDFGGQRIFDALHPLYLSPYGIILLVFNGEKFISNIKGEMLRLRAWLSSISYHNPNGKVFIVCTRADSKLIKGSKGIEDINEAIMELQRKYFKLDYVYNKENNLRYFPIENSLAHNHYLEPLKAELGRVVRDDGLESTWNQEIELSWIYFMHYVHSGNRNVISLSEFLKEAVSYGFGEKDAKEMLIFFTRAGEILDFTDIIDDREEISIVMKPRWLLEVLATLINCRDPKNKETLSSIETDCGEGCLNLIPLLRERKVLSSTVLKYLLEREHELLSEEIEFIVKVCEEKFIMARLDSLPEVWKVSRALQIKNEFWLVPSFFVDEQEKTVKRKRLSFVGLISRDKGNVLKLPKKYDKKVIRWSEIAPLGLYERFVCCFIAVGNQSPLFRIHSFQHKLLTVFYRDVAFQIVFIRPSKYLVRCYSKDKTVLMSLSNIVSTAYNQIHESGMENSIAEYCDFFTKNDSKMYRIKRNRLKKKTVKLKFSIWDCFLSHTWANGTHLRVVQIGEQLKELELRVWIDQNEMRENIHLDMFNGIRNSSVFVAFITKEYLEACNNPNSNAGKEFNFAASRGVEKIIPVVLDPVYLKPSMWNDYLVKFHLSGNRFIDFTTESNVEANITELRDRVLSIKKKARGG